MGHSNDLYYESKEDGVTNSMWGWEVSCSCFFKNSKEEKENGKYQGRDVWKNSTVCDNFQLLRA